MMDPMAIPLDKSFSLSSVTFNINASLLVLMSSPTLLLKLGKEVCFNFSNKGIVPNTPPENIIPLDDMGLVFENHLVEFYM